MLPGDIDAKTGDTVREALEFKHPEPRVLDISVIEKHDTVPGFVELDITDDTIKKVTQHLGGSVGLGEGPAHQTCSIGSFEGGGGQQNKKIKNTSQTL